MIPDDQLPRSRLYELLVQVDRKVAIIETNVRNIEEQVERRMTALEDQLEVYQSRTSLVQYGLIALFGIAGLTLVVLLLLGRL